MIALGYLPKITKEKPLSLTVHDLDAIGHCIFYDGVRRFPASVAIHVDQGESELV